MVCQGDGSGLLRAVKAIVLTGAAAGIDTLLALWREGCRTVHRWDRKSQIVEQKY